MSLKALAFFKPTKRLGKSSNIVYEDSAAFLVLLTAYSS